MADEPSATQSKSVGDRFPALKQLEEEMERAKLEQGLAEARAATVKAKLPDLSGVEIAQDTATVGDKTGLARVLVQMDSIALADDVVDLTLDAVRKVPRPGGGDPDCIMRVVSDPNVFRDVDVFRVVEGRMKNLEERVDALAPGPRDAQAADDDQKADDDKKADEPRALLGPAAIPILVGAGLQAAGLASKLLARSYHVTGEEVAVEDLGFDLLVAHYLELKKRDDETIEVKVDRLLPTPKSAIMDRVWKLALDGEQRLAPVVARHAIALEEARANATGVEDAIEELDRQLQELVKRVPDKAAPSAEAGERDDGPSDVLSLYAEISDRRKKLADGLPALRTALATARERHDEGSALLKDIEEFLTFALTPAGGGDRPPAVQAARVEELGTQGTDGRVTYFLYCRLIAGGIDRTIEMKLGPDRWIALAGAAVEFALLAADGKLLTSGVRSVLQSSSMNLTHPESLSQGRPAYLGLNREGAAGPA